MVIIRMLEGSFRQLAATANSDSETDIVAALKEITGENYFTKFMEYRSATRQVYNKAEMELWTVEVLAWMNEPVV